MKRRILTWLAVLVPLLAVACAGPRQQVHPPASACRFRLQHPGQQAARAMAQALAERLRALGMNGARARVLDQGRVQVDLAADGCDEQLAARLARPPRLDFHLADDGEDALAWLRSRLPGDGSVRLATETLTLPAGARSSSYLLANSRRRMEKFLSEVEVPARRRFAILPGEWGVAAYLVEDPPGLTPVVAQARVVEDEPGLVEVAIELEGESARRFASLTRANLGRRLAIIIDGDIRSLPVIRTTITGGRARIVSSPLLPVEVARRQARSLAASLLAWQLAGGLELVQP